MGIVQKGSPLFTVGCEATEVNSGDCISSPCAAPPVCSPCPESQCVNYIETLFSAGIKHLDSWVVPACDATAVIVFPDLVEALPGSYIWHDSYGYFEIISFDACTHELTVKNNCTMGNAAPGTEVGACSIFIVTNPPCPNDFLNSPYVAANFVIPAVDDCVSIEVTTNAGIPLDSIVRIGTGEYRVTALVDDIFITICNEGSGGTAGVTIQAFNSDGDLQYPITVVNNSLAEELTEIIPHLELNAGNPSESLVTSAITFVNPSSLKAMTVLYTIEAIIGASADDTATLLNDYTYTLLQDVDNGGFAPVQVQRLNNNSEGNVTKSMVYSGTDTIAPGGTKTIELGLNITFNAGTDTVIVEPYAALGNRFQIKALAFF